MQPKLGRSLLLLVLCTTPIVLWYVYRDFPTTDAKSDVTVIELLPEQPADDVWTTSAAETADAITDLARRGRIDEATEVANYALALPRHPDHNNPYGIGHATLALERMIEAFAAYEMWDEGIQFCTQPDAVNIGNALIESKRIRLLATAFAAKRQLTFRSRILTAQLKEVREDLDLRQDIDLHHNEICSPEDVVEVDLAANDAARKHIKQTEEVINAYVLVMRRDVPAALEKLKATETDTLALARLHVAAGDHSEAVRLIEATASDSVYQPALLTALAEICAADKRMDAARSTVQTLNELLADFPAGSSLRRRIRPIVATTSWAISGTKLPHRLMRTLKHQFASERFPLVAKAPSFELPGVKEQIHSLDNMRGEPTLVVFYLGRGCFHCSRQLKHLAPAAEEFEQLGISIVGISCDSVEGLSESFRNYRGRIPFPLTADPKLETFESYRLRPDPEAELLHGTFLVSPEGQVLWQDRGEEPFMDMDFLLRECKRLLSRQKS